MKLFWLLVGLIAITVGIYLPTYYSVFTTEQHPFIGTIRVTLQPRDQLVVSTGEVTLTSESSFSFMAWNLQGEPVAEDASSETDGVHSYTYYAGNNARISMIGESPIEVFQNTEAASGIYLVEHVTTDHSLYVKAILVLVGLILVLLAITASLEKRR